MDKTKIEWADATWNPVTGCFHGCEYCYARRIVERFAPPYAPRLGDPGMEGAAKLDSDEGMDTMLELEKPYKPERRVIPYPMGFYPTLHKYRLNQPRKWAEPRTIFVCSMADLFGEWVPDEWIHLVFDACREAPQHRYLFLTKNWMRASKFTYEDNWWVGRTYTHTENPLLPGASKDENLYLCYGCPNHKGVVLGDLRNTFLSIEPLHGPVDDLAYYTHSYGYQWVIVGAETGNRKDRIIPKVEWVKKIVDDCKLRNIPVFMKDSLIPIIGEENMLRQFPWEEGRQ
ncbi:MAG: DUF5131 family protein [Oscillospiraceae bacterium]|nr:DUF5131 family protein [Oscillospiraceae bacterium]